MKMFLALLFTLTSTVSLASTENINYLSNDAIVEEGLDTNYSWFTVNAHVSYNNGTVTASVVNRSSQLMYCKVRAAGYNSWSGWSQGSYAYGWIGFRGYVYAYVHGNFSTVDANARCHF